MTSGLQPVGRVADGVVGATREIVYRPRRSLDEEARYARRRRVLEISLGTGVPIVAFLLWELGSRSGWIDPILFPSPWKIAGTGYTMIVSGDLTPHILASAQVILIGFAFGALGGLGAGIAMGSIRLVRRALEPTLNALYVVPKLAVLPVFFSMFGFGDASKIALVAVTVFFFVWIQAMESVATVPTGYKDAARSMGLWGWGLFGHVVWPHALPQLFVSLRLSMGVAVLVTTAAEFITGRTGLGFLIFNSRELFLLDRAYVGIVTVAVLGVVLAGAVSVVGRLLTPWETH